MTETPQEFSEARPPVGTLIDFVEGVDENNHLDIEVAVKEDGKVVVFHNRKFKKDISWFEFDLETNKLDFILDNGDVRNTGLSLGQKVGKYMQNSHQILMVLLDNDTGEATQGSYVPLIIHRS
ncbi:MAG: hypothetical protein ACPGRX_05425 [Bdellovibrionales bacterium]